MYVALRSFMSNPLFGLGLGSHPVSYDRFFEAGVSSGFIVDVNEYNVLCKGDSGSLLLRLFSETGLFGVVTVLYFVFGLRIRFNVKSALAVMSNAIFILFVLRLFRLGHYFYNGLFYFVWIYYFAYKFNSGDHDKAILKNP
jgi:voltage-gated potassium channel Kch